MSPACMHSTCFPDVRRQTEPLKTPRYRLAEAIQSPKIMVGQKLAAMAVHSVTGRSLKSEAKKQPVELEHAKGPTELFE